MNRRRISIGACASIIVASLVYSYTSSSLPTPTQHLQQKAMTLRSTSPDVVDHQRQCVSDAREHIHLLGGDNDPLAHITQHYNERLKRCFIEIDTFSADAGAGAVFSYQLGDTSGREYANFTSTEPASAVSANSPSPMCAMTMSSGDTVECNSFDEFEEFVRSYME
jgi:hypothetical protein